MLSFELICDLVKWDIRRLDEYLAYFVIDILDIFRFRAVGWWQCRVRAAKVLGVGEQQIA